MGAPGGGGGGSGFDYTMGGRSYTDNDNRVVVGYPIILPLYSKVWQIIIKTHV